MKKYSIPDWFVKSLRVEAGILGPIIEGECGPERGIRILDSACGIGTQALGLARRGHFVTGCDLSAAAVERARVEASTRGLELRLYVANMPDLGPVPEGHFDAAVCIDNAPPHLENEEELLQAAVQIRSKCTSYGTGRTRANAGGERVLPAAAGG